MEEHGRGGERENRVAQAPRRRSIVRKGRMVDAIIISASSVTANIGWCVVSILHDWPSCNIDFTWPVEWRLWVDRMTAFLGGFPFRIVVFHFSFDIT